MSRFGILRQCNLLNKKISPQIFPVSTTKMHINQNTPHYIICNRQILQPRSSQFPRKKSLSYLEVNLNVGWHSKEHPCNINQNKTKQSKYWNLHNKLLHKAHGKFHSYSTSKHFALKISLNQISIVPWSPFCFRKFPELSLEHGPYYHFTFLVLILLIFSILPNCSQINLGPFCEPSSI